MSIDDFMEGIHILQDNYNKKLTTAQLKLFYENLKDMNRNRYLRNMKEHIKTNSFMLNIAQLRKETSQQYVNYEQRDYSNVDFDKLFANVEGG